MVTLKITPGGLKGRLFLPPSKSHTMRAIVFGSMGVGKTVIHNYLKSPDTYAMVEAFKLLGVAIDVQEETIAITGVDGRLKPCENVIDAGNSGQVLRFVAALSALLPTYTILTGDESIRNRRPVEPLLSALKQLNAFAISSKLDGKAPIIIRGPLSPGYAEIEGEDSQPISALLMAASFLEGKTHLKVKNPGEKPWIDLTLSWLKKLGGTISHNNYEEYTITGPLRFAGFEMVVPGDFSSAAFPIVAALITQSELLLENVDMEDSQGDKKIIALLKTMGACFEENPENKSLRVLRGPLLQGRVIDANEIIDAVPILAVLGCFARGKTEIMNASIARKKESDRIHAIAVELRKMGADIIEREDGLTITPTQLVGAHMFSHHDHRIAMALIVAALGVSGDSSIVSAECIAKSYPSFIADFQKIGLRESMHYGK